MLNVVAKNANFWFNFYYRIEGIDFRLRDDQMRWHCESSGEEDIGTDIRLQIFNMHTSHTNYLSPIT